MVWRVFGWFGLAFGLGVGAMAQPGLGGVYVSVSNWSQWANVETGPDNYLKRIQVFTGSADCQVYDSIRFQSADTLVLDSVIVITHRYRARQGFWLSLSQTKAPNRRSVSRCILYLNNIDESFIRFSLGLATEPNTVRQLYARHIAGTYQSQGLPHAHWLVCQDSANRYQVYYAEPGKPYVVAKRVWQPEIDGHLVVKRRGVRKTTLRIRPAGLNAVEIEETETGAVFRQIAPGCAPESPTLPPRAPFDPLAPENFDRRTLIFD